MSALCLHSTGMHNTVHTCACCSQSLAPHDAAERYCERCRAAWLLFKLRLLLSCWETD